VLDTRSNLFGLQLGASANVSQLSPNLHRIDTERCKIGCAAIYCRSPEANKEATGLLGYTGWPAPARFILSRSI
jgi:hypothetical protein